MPIKKQTLEKSDVNIIRENNQSLPSTSNTETLQPKSAVGDSLTDQSFYEKMMAKGFSNDKIGQGFVIHSKLPNLAKKAPESAK